MKQLLALLFISHLLLAQSPDDGVRHEFTIRSFHTEGGAVLPEAHIVYGTWGRLNPAKDNAVLLPSHYLANYRGYTWLIGQDRALDPAKLFLVATELFGSGNSSR
jgi:homoserine O-acetyltransferase